MDLTPQQDLFCRYYTQNTELFGNGTLAYGEAYDYNLDELSKEKPVLETDEQGVPTKFGDSEYQLACNVCAVQASKLLRLPKIQNRVRVLLNEFLRDDVVDAQLARIIMEGDDNDRIAAIKEYNKLRQRIIDKQDITSNGEPINSINYIVPDGTNSQTNVQATPSV